MNTIDPFLRQNLVYAKSRPKPSKRPTPPPVARVTTRKGMRFVVPLTGEWTETIFRESDYDILEYEDGVLTHRTHVTKDIEQRFPNTGGAMKKGKHYGV